MELPREKKNIYIYVCFVPTITTVFLLPICMLKCAFLHPALSLYKKDVVLISCLSDIPLTSTVIHPILFSPTLGKISRLKISRLIIISNIWTEMFILKLFMFYLWPLNDSGKIRVILDLNRASYMALVVRNLPANAGDARNVGSVPSSGRSPGVGTGNPLQYSCLENPMDRGTGGQHSMGLKRVGHDWATNTIRFKLTLWCSLILFPMVMQY